MKTGFSTPVLVIGSGFAGATVALKLIEQGIPTALLERGPWRDTLPVKSMGVTETKPLPVGRHFFTTLVRNFSHHRLPWQTLNLNRANGVLECAAFSGVNLMCGSGVGGGSHVYGGLLERSPNACYWDEAHEQLSEKSMEPYESYVLRQLKPRKPTAADKVPNYPPLSFTEADIFTANPDNQPGMGLLFSERENSYPVSRLAAGYRGDSVFGSPNGSKVSVDFALLKPALEKGLKLFSQCEVESISKEEDGYSVAYYDHRRKTTAKIIARQVVMAAGTLNTVKLLLHSQPKLNPMPALGSGFGTNGDYPAYWRCQHQDKDYSQGTPCHGRVRINGIEQGPDLVLANLGIPLPNCSLLQNTLLAPLKNTRKDLMIIGMGADKGDGCMRWQGNRLDIQYNASNSPIFAAIREQFDTITTLTAKPVYYVNKAMTVHQYGGARMAASPDQGVVNHQGEVFNNPDLFVADAAALPRAVGGPPSITVATWAAWVADQVAKRCNTQSIEARQFDSAFIAGLGRYSTKALDGLFAILPLARPDIRTGVFKGHVLSVAGVGWLPGPIQAWLMGLLQAFLGRYWLGKQLQANEGSNRLFYSGRVRHKLAFNLSTKLSRCGTGLVHQLSYDRADNPVLLRSMVGEARRLNSQVLLARVYMGNRKLAYYLLSKDA